MTLGRRPFARLPLVAIPADRPDAARAPGATGGSAGRVGADALDCCAAAQCYVRRAIEPYQLSPEAVRPVRRVEYERLVSLGCFENEQVELLYVTVVRMSPRGSRHDAALERLTRILVPVLVGRVSVRIQSAFAASDSSEPEPDVAVVPPGDYDDAHPSTAWLIIEVADSSLPLDCGLKARLYAESGVPECWVVNLPDRLIEVHQEPVGGAYTRLTPFRPGEASRLGRFPGVEVPVASVLR